MMIIMNNNMASGSFTVNVGGSSSVPGYPIDLPWDDSNVPSSSGTAVLECRLNGTMA